MQNTYRATWAATITTKTRPTQNIMVHWTDRAPAEYPAALLPEILSDPAGQAATITDAETGEIIFAPGYWIDEMSDILGRLAIMISDPDDASGPAYTWTEADAETDHPIRYYSSADRAAETLSRSGWEW